MTHLDIINGSFEAVGAAASWMNVRRLRRDRQVHGVVWSVTAFWGAWGLWNLYYYSSLGHVLSCTAGLVLALGNVYWAALALQYSRNQTRAKQAREMFEQELAARAAARRNLRKYKRGVK